MALVRLRSTNTSGVQTTIPKLSDALIVSSGSLVDLWCNPSLTEGVHE
jgi:hypothetical protein